MVARSEVLPSFFFHPEKDVGLPADRSGLREVRLFHLAEGKEVALDSPFRTAAGSAFTEQKQVCIFVTKP